MILIQFLYSCYFHLIKLFITILFSSTIILSSFLMIFFPLRMRESVGYYIGKYWGKMILWASFVRVQRNYLATLDPTQKYVFTANHQSSFDIYLIFHSVPQEFVWIAKKSLFMVPLLGWAMKLMGHIGVERENSQKSAISLKQTVQKIKSGTSIAIFPEGTRSEDGKLLPFKKGAFALARLSGLNLVPIYIKNSYQVAKKGKFIIDPFKSIEVSLFPPIDSKDKQAEEKIKGLFDKELQKC